jgi:hypothetical protein
MIFTRVREWGVTMSCGRRIAVSCELFWCRCRDPRELGSCCSALLCSGCGGVVLPLDPLGICSHLPHIFCANAYNCS